MIVKILSSSGSFAGVSYNEDKVEKGTAELIAKENFGMLQSVSGSLGVTDYKNYFQCWSRSESNAQRVRQPQFHAVISCSGREKDAHGLLDIATQYLHKMGYGENPSLIYFHSDTANNHVHLVSSRVNQDGRKIEDAFERTRSQKAIKEIMLQDMGEEIRGHVEKALRYSFSTPAQFKLLLEQNDVKVSERDRQYDLVKYGTLLTSVSKDAIQAKMSNYVAPEERIKQLRAVIGKYNPGLSEGEFKAFLKAKFGVEIIYHQTKGKEAPYGYSIIDHAQKQVFKGSQIKKLRELLAPASKTEQTAAAQAILYKLSMDTRGLTYPAFKKQLKDIGFSVNKQGVVKLKGQPDATLQVGPEVMRELHYNERLKQANKFVITSQADIKILTRAFHLKLGSLKIDGPPDKSPLLYTADRLNSMLANGHTLAAIFHSNQWSLAISDGRHYLIDRREREIYPIDKLTSQKLDFTSLHVLQTDRGLPLEASRQLAHHSAPIGSMLALLASIVESSAYEQPEPQHKKKRTLKR